MYKIKFWTHVRGGWGGDTLCPEKFSSLKPAIRQKMPLSLSVVTLGQKCKKGDFLGYCPFTQIFHDVEKLVRKPKIFVKVIQRFLYEQHVSLIFFKIHPNQPKLQLW